MSNGRHIIWTDDLDYDDWKADLEEQYPDLADDERMALMYELNGDYPDDERTNLNIQLSHSPQAGIGAGAITEASNDEYSRYKGLCL